MLLFSANRLCRAAAYNVISIVAAVLFCGLSYGDLTRDNKGADLFSAPQSSVGRTPAAHGNKTIAPAPVLPPPTENLKNLMVFVGKCPYSPDAIKKAKEFASERKDYRVDFYMVESDSDYDLASSPEIKGIEFHLPVQSMEYNIVKIPAYVIQRNGAEYKIAGSDVDINKTIGEIEKGEGDKRNSYRDIGVKGQTCGSIPTDFKPAPVPTGGHQAPAAAVIKRAAGEARLTLPRSRKPAFLRVKMESMKYAGFSEFVVFSEADKKWALQRIKQNGSYGCCTDCINLNGLWPAVSYCPKSLLGQLRVKSVPAVVQFSP